MLQDQASNCEESETSSDELS